MQKLACHSIPIRYALGIDALSVACLAWTSLTNNGQIFRACHAMNKQPLRQPDTLITLRTDSTSLPRYSGR